MQYGDERRAFFVYNNVICSFYGTSVVFHKIIYRLPLLKRYSFCGIYLYIYRNFTNITPKDYIFAANYAIIYVNVTLFGKRER